MKYFIMAIIISISNITWCFACLVDDIQSEKENKKNQSKLLTYITFSLIVIVIALWGILSKFI